ncbi:hypothetical protein PFUGPA_02657 [Plasmodium falciparum Palo Alto/Uganda]|uniref:Uncharacterized protein n=5 Tax=Plasmodium falciparum TaxID=5833 RepID=W4IZQ8_PLAFP|nr:hypothetical protein PFFCH_03246 [Plasmodium falciparum FCH/4]ETW55493.1 hypothetical protein PFUGPA_02657 [Plasmodium falciparum Palo Alto/Uganda]ETW59172.1 hypothetical protein PFMC_04946 [Plasmodium falciparum CAMP/Malaysia]
MKKTTSYIFIIVLCNDKIYINPHICIFRNVKMRLRGGPSAWVSGIWVGVDMCMLKYNKLNH